MQLARVLAERVGVHAEQGMECDECLYDERERDGKSNEPGDAKRSWSTTSGGRGSASPQPRDGRRYTASTLSRTAAV